MPDDRRLWNEDIDPHRTSRTPESGQKPHTGGAFGGIREMWGPHPEAAERERGRHAGLGPRGYVRSDARIWEEVCDRLTAHPDLDPRRVEVSVREGIVTFEGQVDERRDKRLAEELAESVLGVRDVHNRIEVRRR